MERLHSAWIWAGLLAVLVLYCDSASVRDGLIDSAGADEQTLKERVFMAPRTAKSFLRVRRGWGGFKTITGEEEEEEEESGRERNHRAYLARTCPSTCWGSWSSFSACSVPCGSSGLRTRTRSRSPPSQCRGWVNQHGCPGSSSHSQPCNRSCHNGGALRASDCSCPAGFKGHCCEQRVTCGYPGKPKNGEGKPAGSSHYYNTVATFTCNSGYRRSGSPNRKCLNNGQWSNSVPSCQIVSCGDPGTPLHGSRRGADFTYEKTVVYQCNEAYRLVGSSQRQCQASGAWTGNLPKCEPVVCPSVPSLPHGSVQLPASTGNIVGSKVSYSCDNGFYLEGSHTRTCQLTGNWAGVTPQCKQIQCDARPAPDNGFVSLPYPGDINHGVSAVFSCKPGYVLKGSRERTCGGAGSVGVWTGDVASCQAVSCGDPGLPEHGTKLHGDYTFPHTVAFHCFPGYVMEGSKEIDCRENGRWSASKPACKECPLNSYKLGASAVADCTKCPDHTHTVSRASTASGLCLCDVGYLGPPGGPCELVTCERLSAPQNGVLSACGNTVNSTCELDCVAGFIRSRGPEARLCRVDGTWSGLQPECSACPQNTYKESAIKCTSCHSHSHTKSIASSLQDCICDVGYTRLGTAGGECEDIDECAAADHGCEQSCQNLPGTYKCTCDIRGFEVDPQNPKACIAVRSCPVLTPPDNGGLVCGGDRRTNTERCEVKCNDGYEYIDRSNAFEECGPDTDWIWSHEINMTPLLPCVEQFFTGITIEAEVAYFVDQCDKLTDDQIKEVKIQFSRMMRIRGICTGSLGKNVCNIKNIDVTCGDIDDGGYYRRKRSADDTHIQMLKIKFAIEIEAKSQSAVNCTNVCESQRIALENCSRQCVSTYYNMTKESMQTEMNKLTHAPKVNATQEGEQRPEGSEVNETETVNSLWRQGVFALKIGDSVWLPSGPVKTKELTRSCESGMALQDNGGCVPCPPGTFLTNSSTACELCPVGHYQPLTRQMSCLPCSDSNNATGRTNCTNPVTTTTESTTTMPTTTTTTPTTTATPTATTPTTTTTTTTPTTTTTTPSTTTVPKKQIFIHIDFDNIGQD